MMKKKNKCLPNNMGGIFEFFNGLRYMRIKWKKEVFCISIKISPNWVNKLIIFSLFFPDKIAN